MDGFKAEIIICLAEEEYRLVIDLLKKRMMNTYDNNFINNFFIHYNLAYCYSKEKEMETCMAELKILEILFKNDENKEIYNYDYKKYKKLKKEVDNIVKQINNFNGKEWSR